VRVFTAEEVWKSRYPDADSVHLSFWPDSRLVLADEAKWAQLRSLREKVTEAIEPLRREKVVRSGLEAEVVVPAAMVPPGFSDADLAELFITAAVTRGDGDAVSIRKSGEAKCGRCWRLLPDVTEDGALCDRCDDAVAQVDDAGKVGA
jgi:isoleucyl-tRNA synthetase